MYSERRIERLNIAAFGKLTLALRYPRTGRSLSGARRLSTDRFGSAGSAFGLKVPLLCILLFCFFFILPSSVVADSRTWTHQNGRTFFARCTAIEYPSVILESKDGQSYSVDLKDLSDSDRWYVWVVFSADSVAKSLEEWQQRIRSEGKESLLSEEDRATFFSLVKHFLWRGKPLTHQLGADGQFEASSNRWQKIHSGILYYAMDWLSTEYEALLDPRTDIENYSLKKSLDQLLYIQTFITTLESGGNYVRKRIGHQFPIKFKPEGVESFLQPYTYYAFIPQNYEGRTQHPSIFFLPGEGAYGFDLSKVRETALPYRLDRDPDYPFIVISIGHGHTLMGVSYLRTVYADVIKRFGIDLDRVICTGMSSGASATWRWACKDPHLFSAIVPVAGVMPHFEIQRLTKLPIWLFNNQGDNLWIQKLAIGFLEDKNPHFKYTIYKDGVGHDAWSKAYNDPQLDKWLLEQKRTAIEHPPNPIEALKLKNKLSEAAIKEIPGYAIINFNLRPIQPIGDNSLEELYYIKNGLAESYDTHRATNQLIEFFKDKTDSIIGPMVQVIGNDSKELSFGFPYQNIARNKIFEPFKRIHLNRFWAYTAFYYGSKLNTSVPYKRLKIRARDAGYKLTGKDRIIYHQLMTPHQYVFEIQLGIEQP